MDNPVQMGTDLKHAPACCKRGSVPFLAALFIALCFAGVTAFAETPLRNSLDTADMRLMAEANLSYSGCLQEKAQEYMASSPDVRVIAGNAAEACNPILAELESTLTDRGINPAYFMGGVLRIKNRAIRRVLPLLMMEKSNQGFN